MSHSHLWQIWTVLLGCGVGVVAPGCETYSGRLIQARDTRGGQNPTTQPAAEQAGKQRKAVMNDVINVVQSAVNIAPDQVTATMLEVNEPTETLVIKGTPEQRDAAESVLRALEPRPGMVVRGEAWQRGGGNRQ